MDGDFSHSPEHIADLLEKRKVFDLVIGSRYINNAKTENWTLWRKSLSLLGNWYLGVSLSIPIKDITGGFNALDAETFRSVMDDLKLKGYAFTPELKYRLYKKGSSYVEVPILFKNRRAGKSKLSFFSLAQAIFEFPKIGPR